MVEAELFDRGLYGIGSNDLHLHVGLGKGRQRTDGGNNVYNFNQSDNVRMMFLDMKQLFLPNVINNISLYQCATKMKPLLSTKCHHELIHE